MMGAPKKEKLAPKPKQSIKPKASRQSSSCEEAKDTFALHSFYTPMHKKHKKQKVRGEKRKGYVNFNMEEE